MNEQFSTQPPQESIKPANEQLLSELNSQVVTEQIMPGNLRPTVTYSFNDMSAAQMFLDHSDEAVNLIIVPDGGFKLGTGSVSSRKTGMNVYVRSAVGNMTNLLVYSIEENVGGRSQPRGYVVGDRNERDLKESIENQRRDERLVA